MASFNLYSSDFLHEFDGDVLLLSRERSDFEAFNDF
jgi:hypothetical protein